MRILLLLCIWGCTGAVVSKPVSVDGTVSFERVTQDDWKITYCFDTYIELFGFERPIPLMRKSHWRSLNPEMELQTTDQDTAYIRRKDGSRFQCAAVGVKTYTALPPKNYYAFSTYSDGGASIYTGFFTGSVFEKGERLETRLQANYVPRDGEIVLGHDLSTLGHQFVYFGSQEIVETKSTMLVIDPQMPSLARDRILSAFDKANVLLKDLFNFTHKRPYMVFMAAGELYSYTGTSIKGGTRPSQIRFTLKGKGAADVAENDPNYYPKFALHEMLHIWQEDAWYDQLGEDRPWIHEGAADALAYEMMRFAGLYDEVEYSAVWRSVEQRCQNLLGKTSVHDGPLVGEFDIVYQCGAYVNYLIGKTLQPENPGAGIIDFWRAMTNWNQNTIVSKPSEELVFATLRKLNFNHDQITLLKSFLTMKPSDPEETINLMKSELGIVP